MPATARTGIFLVLCAAVIASQHAYDVSRARYALPDELPSKELVRSLDLGLHAAAASLLWLDTRTELPFLPKGPQHFLSALQLVNDLDPRFSEPYAFSVLVLPTVLKYPERLQAALAVGERGLAAADPNWQIPFYMGAIYQLELNNSQNAARYYDLAAATPGVPELIRRFAINYGIRPDSLAATKQAWAVIYESSPDPAVRDRAVAHIAHLEILELLDAAVQQFHQKNGRYPADLEEVVRAGFLGGIPKDPFGFNFKIYDQGVVGIAP